MYSRHCIEETKLLIWLFFWPLWNQTKRGKKSSLSCSVVVVQSLYIALRSCQSISCRSFSFPIVVNVFGDFFCQARISARLIPKTADGLSYILWNSNAIHTILVLFVSMCSHFCVFLSLSFCLLSLGERGLISIEMSILVLWIYNFNEIIFGAEETNDLISGYHFRTQIENPL